MRGLLAYAPDGGAPCTARHRSRSGDLAILVVLLPILPCLLAAPLAIIFVGIVLPLWLVSLVLTGAAWLLVAPLDALARMAGAQSLHPARRAIARALHQLTHPKVPERFKKKA